MISKIILTNFEGHKNSVIELSDGVNIIAGESNAGKSSIFRALRFVFLNEPGGEEFINFDSDFCEVVVEYNNHTITRRKARNNKENLYKLNDKEFKAFGQSVPKEIQQALQLNEINFEWQFDKRPFLISETGGHIASKLNEIVNLELIDSSLRAVDSKKRKSNRAKDELGTQTKDLEQQVKDYDWVDVVEAMLVDAETLQSKYNDNENKVNYLSALLNETENVQNLFDSSIVADENELLKIRQSVDTYSELHTKHIEIEKSIVELNSLVESVADCSDSLFSERRINRVRVSIENYQSNYKDAVVSLYSEIKQYEDLQSSLDTTNEKIRNLHDEYEKIKPDTCPLCGGEFHKELEL